MPELLVEIFSEEIPPLLQRRASCDLGEMVCRALDEKKITHGKVETFVTPRRLGFCVQDVASVSADLFEEKKGPRVDAPEKALEGFFRSVGMTAAQCQIVEDKKGAFYVARVCVPGCSVSTLLPCLISQLVLSFPWPKTMAWGQGKLRWIRPVRRLLAVFDGQAVNFSLEGLIAGNETVGHRFLSPHPFGVKDFLSYEEQLRRAYVMLSSAERMATIDQKARALALSQGLRLVEDPLLLEEIAGLVEWPVVLIGTFDPSFLAVPREVLVTSFKNHQRCFALEDPETGQLSHSYLFVSNLLSPDGGHAIVEGHNRVVSARLADAAFFWAQDCRDLFEKWSPQLASIVFQAQLGTQEERVLRLQRISEKLSQMCGAVCAEAVDAARLCKADLVSLMVGEFPELQGVMGGYYARQGGFSEAICLGISEHYLPQGAQDALPHSPIGCVLSLADKLDSLVGFWAVGEKPTGSKDPYALRRAALGVVRILLEHKLDVCLKDLLDIPLMVWGESRGATFLSSFDYDLFFLFIKERLAFCIKDLKISSDVFEAVFSVFGTCKTLPLCVDRMHALQNFLDTPEGGDVVALVRRGVNILKIEEKKEQRVFDSSVETLFLVEHAEKILYAALIHGEKEVLACVVKGDFSGALRCFAALREPVDLFFNSVMVNTSNANQRENRLRLLSFLRRISSEFGDFSRLARE